MLYSSTIAIVVVLFSLEHMAVRKSSVSFDSQNWKQLSHASNKSKVVNEALRLYFLIENIQAEKECAWSEQEIQILQSEWDHYKKTNEFYSYEETFHRAS